MPIPFFNELKTLPFCDLYKQALSKFMWKLHNNKLQCKPIYNLTTLQD